MLRFINGLKYAERWYDTGSCFGTGIIKLTLFDLMRVGQPYLLVAHFIDAILFLFECVGVNLLLKLIWFLQTVFILMCIYVKVASLFITFVSFKTSSFLVRKNYNVS